MKKKEINSKLKKLCRKEQLSILGGSGAGTGAIGGEEGGGGGTAHGGGTNNGGGTGNIVCYDLTINPCTSPPADN
ncbi:hypothetical protein [Chryseobacterium gossypii]|uniref:hypothetical protein n=1 Tax=Chryseobacterium gossypii TaxID=3231602 RepID=UPI003524C926